MKRRANRGDAPQRGGAASVRDVESVDEHSLGANGTSSSRCAPHINQFWYDLTTTSSSPSSLASSAACLSHFAAESARSFLRHGARVTLWTYQQPMANVPDGVVVADAATVLPLDEFLATMRGDAHQKQCQTAHHSVARASDLFRTAMMATRANEWWFDSDMFCLRPLEPPADASEIWFASCPAKRTSSMAPRRVECAAAAAHSVDGWDGRDHFTFAAFYVPRVRHPVLVDALAEIRRGASSSSGSGKAYTGAMWIMRDVLVANGLGHCIAPPISYSPLAWFALRRSLFKDSADGFTVFGTEQPSAERIMRDSFTVQMYTSNADMRRALLHRDTMHERSVVRAVIRRAHLFE